MGGHSPKVLGAVEGIDPHGKKFVRDAINLVDLGDNVLVEQFVCSRLYGAGGDQVVTFDESGRRDTLGLSLLGDGIEEGLLLLGDIGEYLAEYGIVRCYHIIDGRLDDLRRTYFALGRVCESLVKGPVS